MGKFKDPFLMKSPLNAYADGNDGPRTLPTADLYNDMIGKIAKASSSVIDSHKNKKADPKTDSELKSEEASKDINKTVNMTKEQRLIKFGIDPTLFD